MISALSILDLGLAMNGRLPDIYWDLNLSGTEMRVLRYVYDNCLRLYDTVKLFPRGKDGSPRLWRGKERMADDCGMSYPTFRKNVRNLYKLGLVTTMDGDADGDEPHCIGLTCDFLEPHITRLQTENHFRSPLKVIMLLKVIYDNYVIKFINLEKVKNLPLLFSNENSKPDGTKKFVYSKDVTKLKQKTSTKIVRTPIIVKRTPIVTVPTVMRMNLAKKKLSMLSHVRTSKENEILKICEYYEFKCRQVLNSSGFRALGKDFRNHTNWKYLVRLFDLCEENQWDYKVYVDSQFNRVGYWKRKQLYPYLNQFFSENAIKCYHNYVKDQKENTSIIGNSKIKTSKIVTLDQQIIDEVVIDCESITNWMSTAEKRRQYRDLEPEQLKLLYLSDHWMGLSTFYLASIPWFQQYLDQFSSETFVQEMSEKLHRLKTNKKAFELALNIVQNVEAQMNVVPTLCL